GQCRRLGRRRGGPLVGVPGSTGGIDGKIIALATPLDLDGQQRLGEAKPSGGIVGIGQYGPDIAARGGARVTGGEPTLAICPLLGGETVAGLCVGLEERLIPLGVSLHRGVAEGLLLSLGSGDQEQDETGQE